ncbi:hypothetical protein V5799_010471 [Amblyomma americanum]|uniref:Uncharacterized protein n=1 Tax=Amblyomma americanum TaxID=6943 RepID=A0AAQ4EJL0_AMBAM
MSTTTVVLLLSAALSLAAGSFSCPSLELCSCVEERVDCACPLGDEVLDLFALFEPDVEYIGVRHCGAVYVPPYLVASLSLQEFTLTDIDRVVVRSLAFEKVSGLRTLRLRHVRNLTIEHLALHGLRGTELVELDNVTAPELPPAALAGFSDVQGITVRNSRFGQVHPTALLFAKGKSFRLVNTTVDRAQNGSLVFDSVSTVDVVNCSFGNVSGAPLSATNVSAVAIRGSVFADLRDRGALLLLGSANATRVIFEDNRIGFAGAGALAHLSAGKSVSFARNVILAMGEGSLPLGQSVQFANNSLPCFCNASWMWGQEGARSGHQEAITSSFCSGPLPVAGLRFSDVEPVPGNGTCRLVSRRHKVLARLSGLPSGCQRPRAADGGLAPLVLLVAIVRLH